MSWIARYGSRHLYDDALSPLARLVGGRFDGDDGMLPVGEVPERLWAYPCAFPDECLSKGVHWSWPEERARAVASDPVPYDLDEHKRPDDDGVFVYVFADALDRDFLTGRAREVLHA